MPKRDLKAYYERRAKRRKEDKERIQREKEKNPVFMTYRTKKKLVKNAKLKIENNINEAIEKLEAL